MHLSLKYRNYQVVWLIVIANRRHCPMLVMPLNCGLIQPRSLVTQFLSRKAND